MNETVKTKSQQRHDTLQANLANRYASKGCVVTQALGEVTMVVPREQLTAIATELRDDELFLFEELIDACGIDYAGYGESEWVTKQASESGFCRGVDRYDIDVSVRGENDRFAVVYHLLSMANNQRLRVRVFVDAAQPIVDSVVGIWRGADWFEREAFDLYGIMFSGHPDLRRILTDYGFVGHPFRKDFPLEGTVQMRYDAEQGRVVYEPVTLDPRVLVPRVIREDNRFQSASIEEQDSTDA
ncbi:MAG: NADH-quinone oxidoreductase subunit C [Sedimenticola sp.]|uniref:NADH-quinone oxidoreductase subunit C n=1 Tax=Sedimenticola thiotaurini TaxID=1543721 RepID=A0A558CUX8_9GAMM|nr:NADH-quinone oxidoreductase subunit C [Sedimenticola sp.]TVT52522.1 MAG: NADH-quinone oxidoreductase subunit C [Sedimenticola thiotaurini]MCW8947898.1 NADH-quinone oxidoreductase subunit C [Sedimenticola sp.]MCW8948425.1 NADH-quinone oxidoreductase subunit C [Sedimenticola sp.]MCW8975824.1 NADH-quinone oxidoreductase subunit C [Sedimenticola sp.]